MSVGGKHPQLLRIFFIGINVVKRTFRFIGNLDRIGFVQALHSAVSHIHAGNPVCGSGENEGFVKAHIVGRAGNLPIPVDVAVPKAQMPFSNHTRPVTRLPEHTGKGHGIRIDDALRVSGQDKGVRIPERILAGHQAVSSRRADRRGGIGILKADAFLRQPVDVGGMNILSPVAGQIPISQIVRVNDDYIRFRFHASSFFAAFGGIFIHKRMAEPFFGAN